MKAKNLNLLGTKEFSDQLLNNHFTLCQDYVTNSNKLADMLSNMTKEGKMLTSERTNKKRF